MLKSDNLKDINTYDLEMLTLPELKKMAEKLGLKSRRSKIEMIKDISEMFQEYEEYLAHIGKYTRIKELGRGKEGITFLVKDKRGHEYALKTFKKTKSVSKLRQEYELQKIASEFGVAPKVYELDTVGKSILMQRMDSHLFPKAPFFGDTAPNPDSDKKFPHVTKDQQLEIIRVLHKLDQAGVYQGDANILNFMLRKEKLMLIDYGFAVKIDSRLVKKLGTENPNRDLMTIGTVIAMKKLGYPNRSWKYLLAEITPENRKKYGLVD